MKEMKTRLSAFMDDELSTDELDGLLDVISGEESSITWRHYQMGHSLLSDEPVQLYSVGLTEKIMGQVSGNLVDEDQTKSPRDTKILLFPKKIRSWAIPASIAASAAVAAIMLGSIDQSDLKLNIADQAEKPLVQTVASSLPKIKADEKFADNGRINASVSSSGKIAVANALSPSMDAVENQVIPELNEFILRHNSTASSRQFQPSLSYARVVSHTSR